MKIKNKLYSGEIELLFNTFRHAYSVDGKKIPSVTTILSVINKPALINWSARMAIDHVAEAIEPGKSYDELQLQAIFEGGKRAHHAKKVDAGNIGTFVHDWIEKYINGDNPGMPVNEDLQEAINNFLVWVKDFKVKFLLTEQPVYSREHEYAGILDFVCVIGKEMFIGDIKTSSGIYPEHLMQTAAYRHARQEEYPKEKYAGQLILRIGKKDGSFELVVIRDNKLYTEMFESFLAAQKLQKTLKVLGDYKSDKW